MNGLGGLNKSSEGIVIGMVQLQLPIVKTTTDLAEQTQKIVEMVLLNKPVWITKSGVAFL